MKQSFALLLLLGMTFSFTGCADPAAEMRISEEYPSWPELEKLQSDEVLMPIGTAVDFGDMKTAKQEMQNPEFKAAVEAFASSEIPSKFASDERKAAKEKAVKLFREAIEMAEGGGSSDKLKTTYEEAQAALREVSEPVKN